MIKDLLIAGNTPFGFVSYFNEYTDADKVICLKGGSGVGKSTLLKAVIAAAQSHNYDIISMPCSGDIKSLDMVCVGDRKLTVLDATAPHVVEPECYGVQGEIFNMGDYLDKGALRDSMINIKELSAEKSTQYKMLYNHLRAAESHLQNINIVYNNALNTKLFDSIYIGIMKDYLSGAFPAKRKINGFNSYLGIAGITDYAANYIDNRVVVKMKSSCNMIARKMIMRISEYLFAACVQAERYYSLMFPRETESVAIDNVLFTASQSVESDYVIDLDDVIDSTKVSGRIVQVIDERGCCNKEILKAADCLKESRDCHLAIEKYYFNAMDFKKLESEKAKLLARIF